MVTVRVEGLSFRNFVKMGGAQNWRKFKLGGDGGAGREGGGKHRSRRRLLCNRSV